ncbi:MAG: glycosyl transferase group 1, partial [Owenweeksia sp.]
MTGKSKKKVVVSVTNDLVTDQRVKRSIEVLRELDFEVTFVGRKLKESLPVQDTLYKSVRFKL